VTAGGPKRVAVLVRAERLAEGLRMASALPLCDHEVEVVICASAINDGDADIDTHLDTLELCDARVLGTFAHPRVQCMEPRELADKLAACDHVLTL
jgi:hypothetical protein